VAFPQSGSSSTISRSNWNLEVLIFVKGGKPKNPEKSQQTNKPRLFQGLKKVLSQASNFSFLLAQWEKDQVNHLATKSLKEQIKNCPRQAKFES